MDISPLKARFSRAQVSVVGMSSQTRSVSSKAGRPKTQSPQASNSNKNKASRNSAPRRSSKHGKAKKPHRILKWILGIFAFLLVSGVAAFAYLYITTDVPEPGAMALAQKTTVYYADGKTPIGSYAEQNREIIDCSTLPKYVGNAIVASENRSFYQDNGLDLKGIGRALFNNVTQGTRQGGSTITQQYAERYYLGETTSYTGKLREALLALKITQTQDKDAILCNYMNTIYLGRGAYGIQAAAQNYFGKSAKDLTMPEAAMLAGIIPAPSTWDPAVNAKEAEIRFKRVLNIMEEDQYISAKDRAAATMPSTIKYTQENVYSGPKGYLLNMVKSELVSNKAFTEEELETGGYSIVTTIDKSKQDLMYQVASPTADDKSLPDGVQVGGISINPKDGSIISLYAGDDYLKHQLNNVSQATFQVGSTMKAFTLLGAIQDDVSLSTTFNGNSPRTFSSVGKSVANSGYVSYGTVNLYSAVAHSVNTVFMDLNQHVTAKKTAEIAHSAGITGKIDDTTTFNALGVDALSALDLTRGYATIANDGNKPTLHIVNTVNSSANKELYKASTKTEQVFDTNDVALLQKALTGTIRYGTGKAANSISNTLAGKSGTANDDTAASFVGFTPSVLTTFGIWYPGSDGSAQKVPTFSGYSHGSGYPAHLFAQYMSQALSGVADEEFPTATDNGKVGGPDGTWGYGRASSSSSSSGSQSSRQPSASSSSSSSATSSASPSPSASSSSATPTQEPSTEASTSTPTESASPASSPSGS
jgi:membrane peptidoglycan carboxypeptidase